MKIKHIFDCVRVSIYDLLITVYRAALDSTSDKIVFKNLK